MWEAAAPSAKGRARGRECKRSVTLLLGKPRRYHPSPPRPEASGVRYPNPWVAEFSLQRLEALPAEGLLTMFLVSWSLFSRLSRMKDSVSSSCGAERRTSPEARDHRIPAPQPRPDPTAWYPAPSHSCYLPEYALKGETVPDSLPVTPKSPPTRRVPPRGTPRVPAPLPLSPFSPPDRDRRVDSPALSARASDLPGAPQDEAGLTRKFET